MRVRRRLVKKATYGILLVRVGDLARALAVLHDGFTFLVYEDTNKVLDYGRFREVFKRLTPCEDVYYTGGVYAQKVADTFFSLDTRPQQFCFVGARFAGYGRGIFNTLAVASDELIFDANPAVSVGEFIAAVERFERERYLANGYASALVAADVLGVGGLVNGA